MTDDPGYTVRVLSDSSCTEDPLCPMVGELPVRPGLVQIVAVPVTDLVVLTAYASKIGPGEVLVELDKALVLGVRGS